MNQDDPVSNALDPQETYVLLGGGPGGILMPMDVFVQNRKHLKVLSTEYESGQGHVMTGVAPVVSFKLFSGADLISVEMQRKVTE